ncbi:hypothetical protein A3709_07825 [Halioglobus sp. HI00S01]|uniref:DUF3604 domain-containing protein n=1 Tax=Halioglobus sp. HI00S01 TaxID=1822214 RepID=UPI0007C332C1|nr:DUF3604 domain-containing protein [Halioglobus sp. HI00S01]KZX55176.1 hypothetical protein A3709_07825 [Halioglobus sp. HI00S01]
MHFKIARRLMLPVAISLLASCGSDGEALKGIGSDENASLTGTNSSVPALPEPRGTLERGPYPRTKETSVYPQRTALFGDLHVHTENSFDAYTFASLATPADAYRYARGEAIAHPVGYDIQLDRPLDFYAVTDHGMLMGVAKAAADTSTEVSRLAISERMHDMNRSDNMGTLSLLERGLAFGLFVPEMTRMLQDGEVDPELVLEITRSTWKQNVQATDDAYDPGTLTTFAAYEYTTSTDARGNLHRNVIFRDTERLPAVPYSRLHSQNPEGLWAWMDGLREQGVESLAIPHNSNGSNGEMFKQIDWSGQAMDEAYSEQRLRNEPLAEITQIKGTSETHPMLSDTDEWAGFELMEYRVATKLASEPKGSYVRDALRMGLEMEAAGNGNPYRLGFIGSTDTHVGGGALKEEKYFSKAGVQDGLPERRGSIPMNWLYGVLASWVSDDLVKDVDGRRYMASSVFEYWGASGLAAVWAESNTREAVYAALRRKETFATSGPRIQVRFFAGNHYPDNLINDPDLLSTAYAEGVPMGGSLVGEPEERPSFLVWAIADAEAAPLDRMQVIKGWMEEGVSHEKVFDVACSGGGEVDPVTHRCPDNGAWVSSDDCSIPTEIGASELKAQWQDPESESNQDAFYYVRVLQNPTCRWSTWDALRAGVAPRSDLPRTLQERAWSSPIWYQSPNEAVSHLDKQGIVSHE